MAAAPESAERSDPIDRPAAKAVHLDPGCLPGKNRRARRRRALRNHRPPWRAAAGPATSGSSENIFDLAEEAAVVFIFTCRRADLLFRQCGRQLLEQFLLFLRELLRRHGLNGDQQIAVAAARNVRHALAAQLERGAGLRAL